MVGQQDSREEVADDSGRAKGHQSAEEQGEAAKKRRVGAGQVRKTHHQTQQKQHRPAQLVGRFGPLRGEVRKNDVSALDGSEEVLQNFVKNPTEQDDDEEITQVRNVVPKGLRHITKGRAQEPKQTVSEYPGAWEDREAVEKINQHQSGREKGTDQVDHRPKYAAGVKSRIGFDRAAGAKPGLPGIDPPIAEAVHQSYCVDSQEQNQAGDYHVIETNHRGSRPTHFGCRHKAPGPTSHRSQQLLGRTSQKEKQHKDGEVQSRMEIAPAIRPPAAIQKEATYPPAAGQHGCQEGQNLDKKADDGKCRFGGAPGLINDLHALAPSTSIRRRPDTRNIFDD